MDKYKLTPKDVKEISNIFKANGEDYYASRIMEDKNIISMHDMHAFDDNDILENKKLQNALYSYCQQHKKFNLASYYEDRLIKNVSYAEFAIPYIRFIKSKGYYPAKDEILYEIIENQYIQKNKELWLMFSLASLIKNDFFSAKSFSLLIEENVRKDTPLLHIEKMKKIWDGRFNGIDVSAIAPAEYQFVSEIFSIIETSKKQNFFTEDDGFYSNILIDINLISQENRVSISQNNSALLLFFTYFGSYLPVAEEHRNALSINNFTGKQVFKNSFQLTFSYSDINKKDLIKSLAYTLIGYATTVGENNQLKGAEMSAQNTSKFFDAFIMNHLLQTSMGNNDIQKSKKSKI